MITQAKSKKEKRLKRAKSTRYKIKSLNVPCLTVHRTLQHIYAQIIQSGRVLVVASTNDKEYKKEYPKVKTGNKDAAEKVGDLLAKRAKKKKVIKVAFDRSGFKYHGRVKALADAARKGGLEF